MADYTPVTWSTGDTVTAAQLTAASAEVDELETDNTIQNDKLDYPTIGVNTVPRWASTSGIAIGAGTSGSMGLAYTTCERNVTVDTVMVRCGTGSGATPTLVRFGLYSVAGNGDLTLVASTPSDTTILNTTGGSWNKAFSAPYDMVLGNRYAFAWLVVTAAAMPTIQGCPATSNAAELAIEPRLSGLVAGQTDLPSSVAVASVSTNGSGIFYTRVF